MIYYSLLVRKKSSISLETSFHVVSLKFDNDVNNKSFEYHEFTTRSLIHSLVLLLNQSLMYTPPQRGGLVKEKNINRKEMNSNTIM